ncbi:sporulation protein [Paraliomyxa miuraensis]|uniref:sporulation protein n=1 Tax=Paraliomyxa miuraensis TaxID=376150 RepID=UPI00224DF84A|nr:sporulation protein [Paraliomyxa miuraensis]MCX4242856.1 sporulation protein [Paraliomyxa miuraensis]
MGFSEKMRESLGAEGARVHVKAPEGAVERGQTATASITIVGGTRPATVDTLVVRIVEADRHWIRDEDGARVSEQDAQAMGDRKGLTAGWDRHPVVEQRVELARAIEPGAEHELTVDIEVPQCQATSPYCSHTLNVRADIKGQIDPAGNARIAIQ